MIHVVIDLHANNMVIVAINSNGKVVREAKIPTSPKALDEFFGHFNQPVQAVVECTSFWYWLSDWCRGNNIPLTLFKDLNLLDFFDYPTNAKFE